MSSFTISPSLKIKGGNKIQNNKNIKNIDSSHETKATNIGSSSHEQERQKETWWHRPDNNDNPTAQRNDYHRT